MLRRWTTDLCLTIVVTSASVVSSLAKEQTSNGEAAVLEKELILCCAASNDLYKSIVTSDIAIKRFESAAEAVEQSVPGSPLLILAEGYPRQQTAVEPHILRRAEEKDLKLFIEFPDSAFGQSFGEARAPQWERVVVTSGGVGLGLQHMHLLATHDCRLLDADAPDPLLVMARVAGFDSAVFGIPKSATPVLFRNDKHSALLTTTKLSNFVTARYAPHRDWVTLWQHLLTEIEPSFAKKVSIDAEPTVRPAYSAHEVLPKDAEKTALRRFAGWIGRSRLLLSQERNDEVIKLLRKNIELTPPPDVDSPVGDGSYGILEGYASRILPDGSQLQRTPIRADCQAESAAALALASLLTGESHDRNVSENLLDFLYFKSEMQQRERGDPNHPAFGHIAWGDGATSWRVANYGDDNARTLLASIAAAAVLDSSKYDASMLKALFANLRTTGQLGFRSDRIDIADLEEHGWRHFRNSKSINYSPPFEAVAWACYLWAYKLTGETEFLDRTKIGIRKTMEAYPDGWRWGDTSERARMLLCLAWLVRVEDTPVHRRWLKQVASDLIALQDSCGAIPERLRGKGAGHYNIPDSNEAYGTSETPLIQSNADPVSDQLYSTGFILIGLHEAVAATNDDELRAAENQLVEYVVRIQVRSSKIPYLDGAWFRAFDYERWDYWASSADLGWGAWCAESGWGPAWNAIVLGLRVNDTSLWELTSGSRIAEQLDAVKHLMAVNKGGPWHEQAGKKSK